MRTWMRLAIVGLMAAIPLPCFAAGQSEPPALAGVVGSADEAAMEGVLVSAKKIGSTITITVVSDKDGRFAFPASKIKPGEYALAIRAVGYQLDGPTKVDVSGESASAIKLNVRKTTDLVSQLSNGELLMSMPGTDAQKGQLLNCVGCHTLQRIVHSKYDSDGFLTQIMPRMQGYVNQSIPQHPQLRMAERLMEERGDQRVQVYRAGADFLSTINLSAAPQWSYAFKTYARPTGRATRVIYTEYDLPRETISPHDVIVDAEGMVWFSSFGEQNLGRLDPKTGQVTEFPIAEHKEGFPTGELGLRADREGNLWLGNMYQATIVKFDRKAQTFKYWPLPAAQNIDAAQVNMVSPQSSDVDGKVWTQNNGFAATGSMWLPAISKPGSRSRVRPRESRTTSTTSFRIRRTTSTSPIFASVTSDGSTPRPERSNCSRRQRPARRRDAGAWIPRTGSGSANIAAIASACSTPRPSSSRNGNCRPPGRRLMTSCSTGTRRPGPGPWSATR